MKSSFALLRDRGYRDRDRCPTRNYQQEKLPKKQKQEQFESSVPRNSIQSQFSLLSVQRDNFVRETESAEKELQQVQRDHQLIKNQHDALFESNRQAKQELGQKIEKLAILKEEESRINRLAENESKAVHDCTKHSKFLEKKKVETSKKHTAEIDPINFELAALLEHRIQKKTERYITLRSVQSVVVPELKKALRDKNKPQLLNQRKGLYNSIELLRLASGQHQKCIERLGQLRAAQQRYFETGGATRALEGKNVRQRDHVDLFYGGSDKKEFQTHYD